MEASMFDYIRLSAFVVLIFVLAFVKVRTFLFADAVYNLSMCGFLIIQPTFFEDQTFQYFDSLHVLMQRGICCLAITNAIFFIFFVRKSKDEDSTSGLIACRTLATGFLTLVNAVDQWRYNALYKEKAYVGMLIVGVLWTALSAYHLYKKGAVRPKRGRVSPINLYIKIDVVLMLLMSLPDLLFASYSRLFLSMPVDTLHQHMITVAACVNFSNAIFGIYALGFRDVTERKGYLCCRLTALLLLFGCSVCTVLFQEIQFTKMDTALCMCVYIPVIPAVAGLILTSDRRAATGRARGYNLRNRSR